MTNLTQNQVLLSRFSLVKLLGEGGMGQVWLVQDRELQIEIAIKVIHPSLSAIPGHVELLKNECRNTRQLVHPNIVRVFDFHRTEHLVFISMEYIDGLDLRAYRSQFKNLPYPEVIRLVQPVVSALSYAHELGLVHRDVKSGNILIDGNKSPRLSDFGIAGVFKSGKNALQISSGGSLYCMSPQQLQGHHPQPADDIYALGVLMYELLTGHPPLYPDITPESIRHEIPPGVNQKLAGINADHRVPDALEQMIVSMLSKLPQQRPASMQQIGNQLQSILENRSIRTTPPAAGMTALPDGKDFGNNAEFISPIRVQAEDKMVRQSYHRRQNRVKILGLALALFILLVGGGWLLTHLAKPKTEGGPTAQPSASTESRAGQAPAEPSPAPLSEPSDPAKTAAQEAMAEKRLAEFLGYKKQLDSRGASAWGGDTYTEMIHLGQEADALLVKAAFSAAAEKYEAAIALADNLSNQVETTLQRLLQEGAAALEEGEAEQALKHFSTALMIDPANPIALHNLERAKVIDAVTDLIASGEQHEKNNKLSFALTDFQEAVGLDPESEKAQTALKRVQAMIRDQEFQQLMSSGLAAFHKNNFQLARTELLKARSFKPDSREVQEALNQVDAAIRLSRIEQLRQQARAAEESEAWQKALQAYLAVLEIDTNIQFASQGKARALEKIKIEKRILYYLEKPQVLEDSQQLENAVGLIGEADGWRLVAGGNVGASPRIANELMTGLDDTQAVEAVKKIVEFYQANAKKGERLGKMIDRMGIESLQDSVSAA